MNKSAFSFLQDLFCLMVAMVSISLLLVNLADMYITYQEQTRQKELADDARRICDDFLGYEAVLRDADRGLFDKAKLDLLDTETLRSDLRIGLGFKLDVKGVHTDDADAVLAWSWSSGLPGENRGAFVSSAAVWTDGGRVVPARVVVLTWGD